LIVSHEHKFVFIKTRKTAGTSIEVFLSEIAGDDAIVTPIAPPEPGHVARNYKRSPVFNPIPLIAADPEGLRAVVRRPRQKMKLYGRYWNHMPAPILRLMLGPDIWDSYFKFCFERNPWDKLISLYWWAYRDQMTRPSLDDFIATRPSALKTDWPIYTIDDQIAVDTVGRYECLEEDLRSVLKQLGLSSNLDLPRAKSAHRVWDGSQVFSPESAEMVRRAFHREIEAFGYECPAELVG
jgi:hypothetical protein